MAESPTTAAVDRVEQLRSINREADAFERAWRGGDAPRIEDYLAGAPESSREALLEELLLVEWELRRDRGETPTVDEYGARFPEKSRWIAAALHGRDPGLAATVAHEPNTPGTALPRLVEYELLAQIGAGGMGAVYLARKRHRVEEHRLALKMIGGGRLASDEAAARFVAEMETMARLQHPHIVPILDSGRDAEAIYFAMPYYAAGDLAEALKRQGPLPTRSAAEYVLAVAWAVAYLHEKGIVHRDLKPSNVLLDEHRDGRFPLGRPWLADFGLVKLLAEDRPDGDPETLAGTVPYMAPEQAGGRGAEVGPASDVWALGVLLFELLTGRRPFEGESADEVRYHILNREPPPVRTLRRDVPRDLEHIVMRCLNKDPTQRYANAGQLIDDLTAFQANEPPMHAQPIGPWERIERWARRKPALAARLGVALVLIANIWINLALMRLGLRRLPSGQERFRMPDWTSFADFWLDQLLIVAWAGLSWQYQRMIERGARATPVRVAWLVSDALVATLILWNVEAVETPMIAAYAALIAASGLWLDARLVALTTALAGLGYLALVADLVLRSGPPPVYEVLHVLTLFAAIGVLTTFQIRRARLLRRLYEARPAR
jgi:serine/threonine protein kinase